LNRRVATDPANAVGYSPESGAPGVAEEWYEREATETEELFERLSAHIEQRDDDATVEHSIEVGQPAQTVLERTEQGDIDHVVMAVTAVRGSPGCCSAVSPRR
jgi:nucleotide-binding universal stress UspA family protein